METGIDAGIVFYANTSNVLAKNGPGGATGGGRWFK
jgi:hypothetical protein